MHGDTTAVIGSNINAVKGRYSYDAWGNILTLTETPGYETNFRYAGEFYDEDSGLIYLRNRYYDPSIGRFITEDPAEDGLNWYIYCGGNPVMCVDSEGESAADISNLTIPWYRQQVIWMNGVSALRVAGYNIAADMLHHSLRPFTASDVSVTDYWNGVNVHGTDRINGDNLIYSLRNSAVINNEIDWFISCYEKDGLTHFKEKNISLILNESTDLYLSFNKVKVTFTGEKEGDKWYINVNVNDKYDFAFESFQEINSFKTAIGSAAGSVATIESLPIIGAIKKYEININYSEVRK